MPIHPDSLTDFLGHLRLHGFALVHYGGDALAQAVEAPTAGRTWRDDLERFALSNADGDAEAAWRLERAIETTLFDLNRTGDAGVEVAKAINDATCKV